MKQIFSLLLIVCSFQLAGQNQTASVILKSGDTLHLQKFVQEEHLISGVEIGTNKPRKVAMAAILSIIEGCNYERNEVDDMTGASVKKSKQEKLGGFAAWGGVELHVASIKVDTTQSLIFTIQYPKIFSMNPGAKVLIKCNDEKVYEVNNLKYMIADPNPIVKGLWDGEILTTLPVEVLTALTSCPVTKVRLYFNDGYVELEVKDKNQTNLMKVLRCITSQ